MIRYALLFLWLGSLAGASAPRASAQDITPALLPPLPPDSLLRVEAYNSRLGINTFTYRNAVRGQMYAHPRHLLNYRLGHFWTYNPALDGERFVVRNQFASLAHRYHWRPAWTFSQRLAVEDYAANQTRLATYEVNAQHRHTLPAGHTFTETVRAGLVSDRRRQRVDEGVRYGAEATYAYQDTALGLTVAAHGLHERVQISPRQNQLTLLRANVTKHFDEAAVVTLYGQYVGRQLEDYLEDDIQRIRSDTLTAGADLRYRISEQFSFRSSNLVTLPTRRFRYRPLPEATDFRRQNVRYDQSEVSSEQELTWRSGKWRASGQFSYRQRVRQYDLENNLDDPEETFERNREREKIKDIREAFTTWTYTLRYRLRPRHELFGSSIAQLQRVDTESEVNTQDRDEVLYSGEAGWNARWTGAFRTGLTLSGSYRHFIYLAAAQSIENYKERILRLEPTFRWAQGRFSWNGSYQLWVTYHVRDVATEQDKNRSNRIYLLSHQLSYQLAPRYALLAEGLRRETRLGLLDWERFAESPLDTNVVYDATLRLQRSWLPRSGRRVSARVGYRLFRQNRRTRAGITQAVDGSNLIHLNNITLQHGPLAEVSVAQAPALQFLLTFWLQRSVIYNRYQRGEGNFLGVSYSPEALDQVDRDFIPYFTVQLNWALGHRRRWLRAPKP